MPPAVVIRPQTRPRSNGAPRPESLPSSASASAKPIEMPAPIEAASPTTNAFHELWVANAAANTGASVDTDPSIRPTKPGWMTWRMNRRRSFSSSLRLAAGVRISSSRPGGDLIVLLLLLGEIAQELAGRSVGRARQRLSIKASGGALHLARVRAHDVEPQGPLMPHRLLRDVAADVIPAHERNVVAEFRHEQVDEPAPVVVLLGRHLVEHFGACRVVVVQPVGEIGENARVLLLIADGESQNLTLGQVIEIAHWRVPHGPNLECF